MKIANRSVLKKPNLESVLATIQANISDRRLLKLQLLDKVSDVIFSHCQQLQSSYLRATLCPSRTLISWENRVMSGGSQRNSSSEMDQKYRPARCSGVAQVSRSSSLFSLLSQSNSQLQWRGFPPNDSANDEGVISPDVARTWKSNDQKLLNVRKQNQRNLQEGNIYKKLETIF